MHSIVRHIQAGILDVVPGTSLAVLFEVVLDSKIPFEVKRVPVAADGSDVVRVYGFLDVRQQDRWVRIVCFGV